MTGVQLACVMYSTVLGTGFITLPTTSYQYARNGLWLTMFPGILTALISMGCAVKLSRMYPGLSPVAYIKRILGRIPGFLVGLLLFLFCLQAAGVTVRQYGDFVTGSFMNRTPLTFVIASIALLAGIAVRCGAGVIARSAALLTPIFVLPLLLLVLLYPHLEFRYLFPPLERGIVPVLKGSLTPQAWMSEVYLISFFLPRLASGVKIGRWAVASIAAIVASMFYVNLFSILLLGPDTGSKLVTILIAFRYINVADFFENMEAFLLAMWVVGNFVKLAVFYYAASMSCSELFRLRDYRLIVFPVGILILIFSIWDLPSFAIVAEQNLLVAPFWVPTMMAVLPGLLVIAASIQWRRRSLQSRPNG
nr:spore germination protein [Cohnella lubricantis]